MTIDELRYVFSLWDAPRLSAAGIAVKEKFDTESGQDYRVVYEVTFEPSMLDQARIEFWLTDKGHVAVGIEKYERIAKQLACGTWYRTGFAAGHEPKTVSPNGLQILFNAVTAGRLALVATSFFRTVWSIRMNLYTSDLEAMKLSGYRFQASPVSNGDAGHCETMLTYRAW